MLSRMHYTIYSHVLLKLKSRIIANVNDTQLSVTIQFISRMNDEKLQVKTVPLYLIERSNTYYTK